MKKTLITLAALAMASVAQAATEDVTTNYTFDTNGVADLGDALTQDYSWTLTGTVTLGTEATGEYGSALVATGSDPTAASFPGGFQLFLDKSANLHTKLNGGWDVTAIQGGVAYPQVVTYTLSFDSTKTDYNMTLVVSNGGTPVSDRATVSDDFSITQLITNVHTGSASGWSLGAIEVTRTLETPDTPTPAVPEPTTATLSLLALAGLAARRRRK